jgi:hypothetical protein
MWRLTVPQMLLVHRRITATFQGIERLLVRFRAGRLWRISQRARGQKARARVAGGGPSLSRRFGWLVQAGRHQAASFGGQLQTVLNTPEMVALLAASPQAVRMLRPLCRALAVELPWTVDKIPKERGVARRRKRQERVKPEPFRIPLPRGVLAAARRQGFGKLC